MSFKTSTQEELNACLLLKVGDFNLTMKFLWDRICGLYRLLMLPAQCELNNYQIGYRTDLWAAFTKQSPSRPQPSFNHHFILEWLPDNTPQCSKCGIQARDILELSATTTWSRSQCLASMVRHISPADDKNGNQAKCHTSAGRIQFW